MPFAFQPITAIGPVEVIVTMHRRLEYSGACEHARGECIKLRTATPAIIGFRLWKELSSRKGYALHGVPYILGESDLPPRRVPSLQDARVEIIL